MFLITCRLHLPAAPYCRPHRDCEASGASTDEEADEEDIAADLADDSNVIWVYEKVGRGGDHFTTPLHPVA